MVTQTETIVQELQEEIERLAFAKELLNTQLIKAWRNLVSLEETNTRLFNENQQLILRLRESEPEEAALAA